VCRDEVAEPVTDVDDVSVCEDDWLDNDTGKVDLAVAVLIVVLPSV
jgi:hypothetical protein